MPDGELAASGSRRKRSRAIGWMARSGGKSLMATRDPAQLAGEVYDPMPPRPGVVSRRSARKWRAGDPVEAGSAVTVTGACVPRGV